MDYALELLKRDLASKVKPGSIFVFEHPDFAEDHGLKIQSLQDGIKLLSGATVKFCEGRHAEDLHKHYYYMCNYLFCPECGMDLRPE